jgi:hypothetical protein
MCGVHVTLLLGPIRRLPLTCTVLNNIANDPMIVSVAKYLARESTLSEAHHMITFVKPRW